MDTRVAVISIIVSKEEAVERLNAILHDYAKYIIGRMGLPYRAKNVNIICVAVDAPNDAISALSLPDARGKDLVHLLDGRLVRMHARARKAALGFVLFLRDRGDVELLRERAGALLLASVADEGRVGKSRTRRLAEVRTGLEALRLALALPVAEAVEACPRAFVEMGAEPVRASVALVTRDAVLEELVADRGRVSPDVLGDFWHGEAAPDEELYSVPYVDDHVFHGRILLVSFHVRSRGTRHRRQRTRADRIPETMVVRN